MITAQMTTSIADHLWQSTLVALVAWLVTLALRGNRARVRHAVWLAASVKFLIPFSMLTWLGSQIEWRKTPVAVTPSNLTMVMDQMSQPFSSTTLTPTPALPETRTTIPWPAILLALWAFGFLGIAGAWLIRWSRIRAAVRAGTPAEIRASIPAISSPTLLEPGVFGALRPVLLLPEGIVDRLTPAQLQAVIDHELCHVRHRDNLIATVQMFIETAFWFHPLVWWIGKKIVEERERACDEAVVQLGSEPHVYAEAILNVCKLYVESPLVCVAGVTGSGLKERIQAIVANRPACQLSRAKKLLLVTAAAAAIATPITIGIVNAPALLAQPASTTAIPKWEVISIKPCDGSAPVGRSGGGGGGQFSPGTLNANCAVPMRLIEEAYGFWANGRGPTWKSVPIEGAPGWLKSERYTIAAKAENPQGRAMMFGPMMQTLLEDRFKLKIRKEIREVPIYNLTVAKGGPKNLTASKPGTCVALDVDNPPPPLGDLCKMFSRRRIAEGEREFTEFGVNMAEFSDGLAAMTGRNVIDKTGLSGTFDIKVQVSVPDEPPREPGQPRVQQDESDLVFAVVQKLGMKLEASKGPGVVYVIESIERPTDNFTPPAQPPQAAPVAARLQGSAAPIMEQFMRFDVASVKPNNSGRAGTDGFQIAHGSLTVKNVSLKTLLEAAYQMEGARIAGGPAWMSVDRYDVIAKGPSTATKQDVWRMLQALLGDRFGVKLSRETKELPIYSMELAKGGPKMKKRDGVDCGDALDTAPPAGQKFVAPCGGVVRVWGPQGGVMIGQRISISAIAKALSSIVDRPVVDHSGLSGAYDIELRWTPDGYQFTPGPGDEKPRNESSEPGPSLYVSVQEQLGLRLVSSKGPVEMLVVNRAERPTQN